MSREDIITEIDRYTASIKKIKNVIPLVVVSVTAFIFFMRNTRSQTLSLVSVIAICMYVGSFVLAYYQCTTKIKKLEEKLKDFNT